MIAFYFNALNVMFKATFSVFVYRIKFHKYFPVILLTTSIETCKRFKLHLVFFTEWDNVPRTQ